MNNLVERARKILLEPQAAWVEIRSEDSSTAEVVQNYLIYMAAIPVVSHFLGQVLLATPRLHVIPALIAAVVFYLLIFIAITIAAMVINAVAPEFQARNDETTAFKLVAYSCTAPFLASAFLIIPALSTLAILGFYGIYILYLGIPELTDCPQDKALGYTVASVITLVVLTALTYGLASIFTCR